jgi:hypothetical protein
VSVRTLRFNPVPWLTTVTLTPGTTAPLGSVMAPETAASWVWDHASTERSTANNDDSMLARYNGRAGRWRDVSVQRIGSKEAAACGIDGSAGKSSCGLVYKGPPSFHEFDSRLRRGCAFAGVLDIFPLRVINCHQRRCSCKLRAFAKCCVDPPTLAAGGCRYFLGGVSNPTRELSLGKVVDGLKTPTRQERATPSALKPKQGLPKLRT